MKPLRNMEKITADKTVSRGISTKLATSADPTNRYYVPMAILEVIKGAFLWAYSGIGIAGVVRIILPFRA